MMYLSMYNCQIGECEAANNNTHSRIPLLDTWTGPGWLQGSPSSQQWFFNPDLGSVAHCPFAPLKPRFPVG
jgi:hypothetical protein